MLKTFLNAQIHSVIMHQKAAVIYSKKSKMSEVECVIESDNDVDSEYVETKGNNI